MSVIVPAANSSNLLKSRSFSGRLETSALERCSPPLPFRSEPCGQPATATPSVSSFAESVSSRFGAFASVITIGFATVQVFPAASTANVYVPASIPVNTNVPFAVVQASYVRSPGLPRKTILASATGFPTASRKTPFQVVAENEHGAKISVSKTRNTNNCVDTERTADMVDDSIEFCGDVTFCLRG